MDINEALRQFEATQANIAKLERISAELDDLTPKGIQFGRDAKYEDRVRAYEDILSALPKIDGWKPEAVPMDLDSLAQARLDAKEVGEIEAVISVEQSIEEPSRQLALYKHKLNTKRRPLIRRAMEDVVRNTQEIVDALKQVDDGTKPPNETVEGEQWEKLKVAVRSIDLLLGDSLPRPSRWGYLGRHLSFGMYQDLRDIVSMDWPEVKAGLLSSLYADDEPLPVAVEDLGSIAESSPTGPVISKLNWESLTDDLFERLMFSLLGTSEGYQNPEWLTRTNAPDRGRDLSATRIIRDSLGGNSYQRVIIQCKHWLSASVGVADVSQLIAQMQLWTSPKVDVLVIATTGRFTTDAVQTVENHNHGDRALKIEMWPDSHLERILAERPDLVAEFRLR